MTRQMNQTVFKETIHAPEDRVWDVLFKQYGDIHVHNPTMVTSNYLGGATKGALNVVRHCEFSEKLFLDEEITEVTGTTRFKVVVVKHNLPFVKHMSAIYEIKGVGDANTELTMTSFNSFSPRFMKYMMRGQMAKSLRKHLFGMKYFAETGQVVTAKDYDAVQKAYHAAAR